MSLSLDRDFAPREAVGGTGLVVAPRITPYAPEKFWKKKNPLAGAGTFAPGEEIALFHAPTKRFSEDTFLPSLSGPIH
jgi:hypothetical protein